ncbi:hypothetical protein ElyMa_001124800 [Elysia marginata]|uniref:Uncharacterized protein n=1 Tax=Elysia marginata TaxID=1093978 RepID=A0AAV4HWB9_9GAST|nr:hypothetical protein ElyMa_001124800 [Elysia marginata]
MKLMCDRHHPLPFLHTHSTCTQSHTEQREATADERGVDWLRAVAWNVGGAGNTTRAYGTDRKIACTLQHPSTSSVSLESGKPNVHRDPGKKNVFLLLPPLPDGENTASLPRLISVRPRRRDQTDRSETMRHNQGLGVWPAPCVCVLAERADVCSQCYVCAALLGARQAGSGQAEPPVSSAKIGESRVHIRPLDGRNRYSYTRFRIPNPSGKINDKYIGAGQWSSKIDRNVDYSLLQLDSWARTDLSYRQLFLDVVSNRQVVPCTRLITGAPR